MRVMVVDDLMLMREGIAHVLEGRGVTVVAQVDDASTLLAEVDRERPDVVIVDIKMPPTFTDEGVQAAREIRARFPSVGVLVLSQYVEPRYAALLLEEHPDMTGYLLKDRVFDGAVLIDALRRISDGDTVIDPAIVSRLLGRRRPADPVATLSPREREVLSLIAEGLSNKEIAARLVVTERTVEAHATQVFAKLGIDEDPATNRRVLAVLVFLRA